MNRAGTGQRPGAVRPRPARSGTPAAVVPPGTTGGRGAARDTGGRGGDVDGVPGLGGISGARAYTPRGRTVRDAPELRRTPRSTRSADPFRPALQVLDGGRSGATRNRREPADPLTSRGAGIGRPVPPRTARAADVAKPVPAPRRRPATTGNGGRAGSAGRTGAAPRRAPRKPPRPPRLADPRRRLRLGTVLALALFATIGIRLIVLQVVQTPAYADEGSATGSAGHPRRAPRARSTTGPARCWRTAWRRATSTPTRAWCRTRPAPPTSSPRCSASRAPRCWRT